jgi:Na+-transporting methylmalonyl-CoA/oxaloacetate decarboxylase gamma subunit
MTDFQMGLVVSVVGLTITFFALFVFIGVILLLQKIFPPKPEQQEDQPGELEEATNSMAVGGDNSEEAIAAALAASLYLRSRRSGQLGATLLAGPGPYRTSR